MPLTKEVFFRNKKKIISFLSKEEMLLSKEEMLEKIEMSWLSQSEKSDPAKKTKGFIKRN